MSPALLIMTVQMVEPMRTNILAMKAVSVDEKGSKVVLRKTSADKPSPRQARARSYGREHGYA